MSLSNRVPPAKSKHSRESKYAIGLDYGTNSVRTILVDAANGREVAGATWSYEHGDAGVILSRDPNLAGSIRPTTSKARR